MRHSNDRRRRILDLVSTGEEDVDALARRFGVSASTIRRDLAGLSRSGAITRTYGGAVLAHRAPEQTLPDRERIQSSAKEAIARAAAGVIQDGDSVLLDSGSTVGALGHCLANATVRVVTGNLPLVPVLVQRGFQVTILGGDVRSISMGVVGSLAELVLRRLTVDKVFLGADGVIAGRGLCEASPEQCALKELMMAQAGSVFVLADSSKLGQATQQCWAPISKPWTLITDAKASEAQLQPFLSRPEITVLRAR
ncbi:DeoR/GlpR family DNA-binding transcription regulator [Telmatospirillum siberiense]|uniref:DeoR/GlpR transcriptional regulator n=1 Tax=Telmatospirillum siberiense TaxID=382514 RepID=A0A2N3PTW8_9PROT|nr:DeoR/GlpR family DNA-binding transcription regulator [Telmatospirillum siberiense]PKU23849.1 DeoR/GlpR transcriptional regulator [Telmatospirillum siberiense]